MKPFWDDLFYDMDECGLDRESFAIKAGSAIKDDLRRVEDAIRGLDGNLALAIIQEIKDDL